MKVLHIVAFTLVIVGALNWGLIGLFNFNLVAMLFGSMPMIERAIYSLVGVAAVLEAATHLKNCRVCKM